MIGDKSVDGRLGKGGFILLTQSSAAYAATLCAGSRRVPIGVSMRKRLSKKYKPTRVHKRWQKLNDFQDTGLNNVY